MKKYKVIILTKTNPEPIKAMVLSLHEDIVDAGRELQHILEEHRERDETIGFSTLNEQGYRIIAPHEISEIRLYEKSEYEE